MEATKPESGVISGKPAARYTGRVVYLYAFDVAYEMSRRPVTELLGQPVAEFAVDTSRRNPRHLFFFRPQMVRLPVLERVGPKGAVRVERVVKLLPVGAISITVSVPFAVESLDGLVGFHDVEFKDGSLTAEVRRLAEDVRHELRANYVRPVPHLMDEEAYTVFCLDAPLTGADGKRIRAEDWFLHHRRDVAALLTQETDVHQLSHQEAEESTARYLSYYENDLVVMDWDAAVVIDEPGDFDGTLYVMELANLQLAELEAYDRLLDDALERCYRDLATNSKRGRSKVLRELREIRIDLARLSDELSNITKFFGDWHNARIYENISARFHLGDWHRTIDNKLKTLDNLYQILSHDQNNRYMLILEVTIVLLFIIDLVILFLGMK